MSGADTLLGRLHGVRGKGPRWRTICPAHESKHHTRTLAVYESDNGRLLIKCHAGCDVQSILGAVGLDLSDLFPESPVDHAPRVRRPWSARDVVAALGQETLVGWVLLIDVANGKVITPDDRERAKVAAVRFDALISELDGAG